MALLSAMQSPQFYSELQSESSLGKDDKMRTDDELLETPWGDLDRAEFQRRALLQRQAWESHIGPQLERARDFYDVRWHSRILSGGTK